MSAEVLDKREKASLAHAVALRACRLQCSRNPAVLQLLEAMEQAHADVIRATDELEQEMCAVAYSMTEGKVHVRDRVRDRDVAAVETKKKSKSTKTTTSSTTTT